MKTSNENNRKCPALETDLIWTAINYKYSSKIINKYSPWIPFAKAKWHQRIFEHAFRFSRRFSLHQTCCLLYLRKMRTKRLKNRLQKVVTHWNDKERKRQRDTVCNWQCAGCLSVCRLSMGVCISVTWRGCLQRYVYVIIRVFDYTILFWMVSLRSLSLSCHTSFIYIEQLQPSTSVMERFCKQTTQPIRIASAKKYQE